MDMNREPEGEDPLVIKLKFKRVDPGRKYFVCHFQLN